MECFGVEYPRTHDIEQLILKCKDDGIDVGVTDYIDDHSEMFTQWEAKTRYIKNYRLESRKITKALSEVPIFLDSVSEAIKQTYVSDTCDVSPIKI